MAGREEDQVPRSYAKVDLESPYLNEALFVGESDPGWEVRLASFEAENPFSLLDPVNFEEEIIDRDERTLVSDTLKRPNRWICAIDILIDNPKWGSGTNQPKFISKSRGTGILIGPRYVLTARHLMEKQTIQIDGEQKSVEVKGLVVSPARNGDNSSNPLGEVKSKAVRLSQPYRIQRRVRQGSRVIEIPIQQRDDYMLIILENDLDSSTHSRMDGALGYWGQGQTTAVVRCLEPKDLQGKTIVVIGYPGDTCGKDKFSGSKSEIKKKIENCWNRQKDSWASTQWRGVGLLEVVANSTTLLHTADTFEGQSGAPICLTVDKKLHLVGIHTGSENTSRNNGVRVTRRMLGELVAWINEDAGSEIASIQDDTLVIQPMGATRTGAKELADPDAIDPELEEAEEAEGGSEAEEQERPGSFDPELEEVEEAEGSNEEEDQEDRSGFEFEPELEQERDEDAEDYEPEDEWQDRELETGEQPDIFQHDAPKKEIREVVVGERIELDLNTTSLGADLDKVKWTIPGAIVAGYRGTGDKAELFKLSANDLEKPKVTFFWVDAADNRTVVAKIRTKSGTKKEFAVIFDVKGPRIKSFKGKPGNNHIFSDHGSWFLKFGKPGVDLGVRWDWTVTMPPNHAGFIQDLQTVSTKRTKIMLRQSDKKETRTMVWRHPSRTDAHVQLDGTSGEKPEKDPWYSKGLAEERQEAGTLVEGGASDSPETELESLGKTVSINDRFVYYILFKPAKVNLQDAIWVPVARAKWFWKVTAIQRGGKWKKTSMDMTPVIEKKTVEFPIYESFGGENKWLED